MKLATVVIAGMLAVIVWQQILLRQNRLLTSDIIRLSVATYNGCARDFNAVNHLLVAREARCGEGYSRHFAFYPIPTNLRPIPEELH